ncbi:MAG: cryptochrome/photolyase family protein [Maribacter sp.]
MKAVNIILPNQLFKESSLLKNGFPIFLIEEFLFFKQYSFHKQKIAFHRASMKFYADYLTEKGAEVIYVEAHEETSDIRKLLPYLRDLGFSSVHYIDPVDDWVQKRLTKGCDKVELEQVQYDSALFLNTGAELKSFFKVDKKKYYQTSFYKEQRKKRNILIDSDEKPVGGKWTFDSENRKKYPAKKTPPSVQFPDIDIYYENAKRYVEIHFSENLGDLSDQPFYPTNFNSTQEWFQSFLETRFDQFGVYEDAIVAEHSILNHSVLTPMLNVGLITPDDIVDVSLKFAEENDVPINSTEGFIRQIIGWREFIRGMYVTRGSDERTKHFWNFTRKIPSSFYDGTTGIYPIDQTIKKLLKTGYCHHIERLMVLGNFMMLCEFDPDDVYQWFMELFIDSYDWVMVPNIYGMSQFADGGLMSTKPYISGSNYLMKMSDYKKGEWQETWDGLFWCFMNKHRDFFSQNPRLRMLVSMFDKMPDEKKRSHLDTAENYLSTL